MTKEKIKVVGKPDGRVLVINGKKFVAKRTKIKMIDGHEHSGDIIFEELDEKQYEKKTKFITKKLDNAVDKKRVIEEILKSMDLSEINRIYKILKEKKAKVKSTDGCLGISIDGGKYNKAYIELFE